MVKTLLGKDKDALLQLKDKHLKTVFHLAAGMKDSEVALHISLSSQPIQQLETVLASFSK